MIKASEVNSAMLQEAADQLEIGVPIRSWEVRDGELVLRLAYGGEAVWSPDGAQAGRHAPQGVAWRFVEEFRDDEPRDIPSGSLRKVKKQQLRLIALSWGYQTESLDPLKAEFVEALAWLRESFEA